MNLYLWNKHSHPVYCYVAVKGDELRLIDADTGISLGTCKYRAMVINGYEMIIRRIDGDDIHLTNLSLMVYTASAQRSLEQMDFSGSISIRYL